VLAVVPALFTWPSQVSRSLGAVGIIAGAILIGFNPDRWDVVVATLPRGHGIHVRDLVGMVFIAAGIMVLWHAPSRR
jgi:hypothetical protein